MNDEAVYRTAPATPGLLNTVLPRLVMMISATMGKCNTVFFRNFKGGTRANVNSPGNGLNCVHWQPLGNTISVCQCVCH